MGGSSIMMCVEGRGSGRVAGYKAARADMGVVEASDRAARVANGRVRPVVGGGRWPCPRYK